MSSAPPYSAPQGRLALVDAIKAVASQLIVLHHLAFYGPMSDAALVLAPDLIAWLSQHARVAVQAFLVLGGFMAARSLAPAALWRGGSPLARLWLRYQRLVLPFAVVLVLGMACAALARSGLAHDSIPSVPSAAQFLAHLLLLHDLLDYEALAAGAWYVAIDFQLYAVLLGLLWLAGHAHPQMRQAAAVLLVAGLWLASLFVFNRDAAFDMWAIYFFGAYALGVLTQWASATRQPYAWLGLLWGLGALALAYEWRLRIAVALAVALVLGLASLRGAGLAWPRDRVSAFFGRIAYSVFLVHFPLCLVVNMVFSRCAGQDPWLNLVGMLLAWGLSNAAGVVFYRWVEAPALKLDLGGRLRAAAAARA